MPRMSKVELFAAIRRDSRAGMSGRAIATKYRISRHTVSDALASAWPRERKPLPPSVLDPFKAVVEDQTRRRTEGWSAMSTPPWSRSRLP
jgi:transposase